MYFNDLKVRKKFEKEQNYENIVAKQNSDKNIHPRNDSERHSGSFLKWAESFETVVRSVLFRLPRNIFLLEIGNPNTTRPACLNRLNYSAVWLRYIGQVD
jgi:hypothetical protein